MPLTLYNVILWYWDADKLTQSSGISFGRCSFVFPIVQGYLNKHNRVNTLADFVMFALWVTSTSLSSLDATACRAAGVSEACGDHEMLVIVLSAIHSALFLIVIVIRVVMFTSLPGDR